MEPDRQKTSRKYYVIFVLLSVMIIVLYLIAIFKNVENRSIFSKLAATQGFLNTYSGSIGQTQTTVAELNYTPTPLSKDMIRATALAQLPEQLSKGLPPGENVFNNKKEYGTMTLIQEKDKYLEVISPRTSLSASDFIFEVTFVNPSDTAIAFDYGMLFRNQGFNNQYRLIIIPQKHRWEITYWNEEKNVREEDIDDGYFVGISPYAGYENKIRLIAYENQGWLYINDGLAAQFTLLDNTKGKLSIATDMINNQVLEGREIVCKDIKMWWVY